MSWLAALVLGASGMSYLSATARSGAEARDRAPEVASAPRMVMVANVYRDKKLVILSERFSDPSRGTDRGGVPRGFTRYYRFSTEQGRASLATGKGIEGDDLWSRLEIGATVLLSADEIALSPHYRRPLRDDAIILIGEAKPNGLSD